MLLSRKSTIQLNDDEANIVGHMNYAAYKLWNVCNYERNHYKELGLEKYPDWYYQKANHKNDIWFKALPSQTAQEVCKLLDKSWKSFYRLKKTGGIENPNPPKYKHDGTSQCSPLSENVSKEYAVKTNRCRRGLYKDGKLIFQADAVGAYNILRKYNAVSGNNKKLSVSGLSDPKVIKVAV